ncbi:hypothetical protein SLAV_37805 [Streptomyces lavendulae subsp. lavendulae]|uniref:Uncharacterized protein n=1 Tax=Streptomyces lavendulae subsp. lavendulae TaxID=58340 RepID=A0A2K8PUJ2_STRLA|nr:hypothetical protein [Streptomyces lavendulae]ATZ29325.1 hypothetical protein SLAV_37805 [Streptomyces lavendulae subsp. lavendulae]
MRYLVEAFALTALRRGRPIEQFLGAAGPPELPGIRWAEVRPTADGFVLVVHVAQDIGGENCYDLVGFPSFEQADDEEDFGHQIAVVDDPLAAMTIAEERLGAGRDRWVNRGMAGDEYRDYVRTGRPSLPLSE